MRIAACGHTIAHLPQSMHSDGSQTGISVAMDRFSHFDVPEGHAPSTGRALTGSRSPWPCSILAVTRWTKSGASSGMGGIRWTGSAAPGPWWAWIGVASRPGIGTERSASMAASMAAKLRSTMVRPRRP